MIILGPRTFDKNPIKWLCSERKQALAFGRGHCRVEAKSPVCHNSRGGGTCAGQEREMLVWYPWVGKSPSTIWL